MIRARITLTSRARIRGHVDVARALPDPATDVSPKNPVPLLAA